MSLRDLLLPARPATKAWRPSESQETEARSIASRGGAAALAGADLSGVRVHADGETGALADDLGAKAFAYGSDVFFGAGQYAPTTPAGGELLAHEMAHVGQQAGASEPALQFQPKGEKAGIGASPPEEDFIKDPGNWGAEDGHVTFETNDTALEADDEAAIRKLAGDVKEPSNVHVHGYASGEGPADYNLNLSAHRGVHVKHFLETLLPAGSKVYVFAHGESRHFGAADTNRRAGISLMGPVADVGFKPKLHLGMDAHLTPPTLPGGGGAGVATGPIFGPDTVKNLGGGPIFGGGGPAPVPPYLKPIPPLGTPRWLMDNAGLVAPSGFHGVSPSTTGNVVDQWDATYGKYHALGVPDELKLGPIDLGAGSLANKEVTSSIQAYHERNDPTVIEKSNADVGAHVIQSPNLLDLFAKKKDKKGGK